MKEILKMNDFIINNIEKSGLIMEELTNNKRIRDLQVFASNYNTNDNMSVMTKEDGNVIVLSNKVRVQSITICVSKADEEMPYTIQLPLINTMVPTNFLTHTGLRMNTIKKIMQIVSDITRQKTTLTFGKRVEYLFAPCSKEELISKYFNEEKVAQ